MDLIYNYFYYWIYFSNKFNLLWEIILFNIYNFLISILKKLNIYIYYFDI